MQIQRLYKVFISSDKTVKICIDVFANHSKWQTRLYKNQINKVWFTASQDTFMGRKLLGVVIKATDSFEALVKAGTFVDKYQDKWAPDPTHDIKWE